MLFSSFSWQILGQAQTKKISISSLLELGFEQKVSDATHIEGGLIDNVYYRGGGVSFSTEVSLYSPYYTSLDHDALSVTLTKMVE